MTYDIRLKSSFNCIVSGPSGSGKTTWVKNLLTIGDQIFTESPKRVFLFYQAMQDMYIELENMKLVHELIDVNNGFPSLDDIFNMVNPYKDQGGSLLIFDDTMNLFGFNL